MVGNLLLVLLYPFLTTIFLHTDVATPASHIFIFIFSFSVFIFSVFFFETDRQPRHCDRRNRQSLGSDLVDVVVSAAPALFQLHLPRLVDVGGCVFGS